MSKLRFGLSTLALSVVTGSASWTALADGTVTLNGQIDNFIGSMRYNGATPSQLMMGQSGMSTSWYGFDGQEDLGDGMKATFALEAFFQSNNGEAGRGTWDTFFGRNANIGLSGDFGAFTFGRALAPQSLPDFIFNPFGDSFTFSPLVLLSFIPYSNWTNSVVGDSGWSNEIVYSPPKVDGLTTNFHYQFGGVAGKNGVANMGANAMYFSGPVGLTAYYQQVKVNNPSGIAGDLQTFPGGMNVNKQDAWMVGGSYDLKKIKLYATSGKTTDDIGIMDKTETLGASIPWGSGKFMAGWGETQRSGSLFGADKSHSITSVGYDYNLSKRVDLYMIYMNDSVTNETSGNSYAAGMRLAF